MKELNEYTAEVFRRMENRIEERRKRRKNILMCSVPLCLCIVITLAITLPSARPGANIPTGDEKETASKTEEQTAPLDIAEEPGEMRHDVAAPGSWVSACTIPYGIVQIDEITDETVRLYQVVAGESDYVKVKCKVIWSRNTERFIGLDPLYKGDFDDLDFNAVEEIYVTEKSAASLKVSDIIFICVEQMQLKGRYYYGPVTAESTGESEFIPIIDGKLEMSKDDYDTKSFYPLRDLNNTVENVAEALKQGYETDFRKIVPKKKIGNGMTIEEIIEFFAAWDEAKAEFPWEI